MDRKISSSIGGVTERPKFSAVIRCIYTTEEITSETGIDKGTRRMIQGVQEEQYLNFSLKEFQPSPKHCPVCCYEIICYKIIYADCVPFSFGMVESKRRFFSTLITEFGILFRSCLLTESF